MRPTTKRLIGVCVLLSAFSFVGFLLALLFQWPSHFVLGEVADSVVTLEDLVVGTPASIPLAPWVVLITATVIASSRRWWGTLAVIVLTLLGPVFVQGGWGEALGPANPDVPYPVLVVSGLVFAVLGLALTLSGVLELADRVKTRRRDSEGTS